MFYISSRGSSACTWLAKVLSRHPEIVCFRATRSWPPKDQPPYTGHEMRKYVISSDKFMEGLMECERATYGEKVFGSIHGYHGLDAKEPCEKRGGHFSYIIRHPISRTHSAFIYYLYNFYYKKYNLAVENKDVHDRSCIVLSKENSLKKQIELWDQKNIVDDNLFSNAKKVVKNFLPKGFVHNYQRLRSKNKTQQLNHSSEGNSKLLVPEESDHLSRVFVKFCRVFQSFDPALYSECPSSGIKMEEMVKSADYFKNHLLPLVAPEMKITDSYLESVFSGKMEKTNEGTKIQGQRFNTHRDIALTPQEIWSSWPKSMKEYYRRCFEELNLAPVCKAFDYDISFI